MYVSYTFTILFLILSHPPLPRLDTIPLQCVCNFSNAIFSLVYPMTWEDLTCD